MKIRAAELEDWSMIWELFFLMGKTDSQEKVKERFEVMINSEQHYIPVAILGKKLVGYGWVQDYGFHLRAGKKITRLNDLFVLKEYRNMGVARNLFFSIKDWAKQNETTWLQWNSSPSAVQFYQRLGLNPLAEDDDCPFFEIEF